MLALPQIPTDKRAVSKARYWRIKKQHEDAKEMMQRRVARRKALDAIKQKLDNAEFCECWNCRKDAYDLHGQLLIMLEPKKECLDG